MKTPTPPPPGASATNEPAAISAAAESTVLIEITKEGNGVQIGDCLHAAFKRMRVTKSQAKELEEMDPPAAKIVGV